MINSIRARILAIIVLLVLGATATILFYVSHKVQGTLSDQFATEAGNLIESVSQHIEIEHNSIHFHKDATLTRRKQELKNISDVAVSTIQSYYDLFTNGILSEAVAREQAMEALRAMRYEDEVGYIWLNTLDPTTPTLDMHPVLPELEGQPLTDKRYHSAHAMTAHLLKAFVAVCERDGAGYVDYLWPKPLQNGVTEDRPKIAYVQPFQPWQWVVGTGVYIDDIEAAAAERMVAVKQELAGIISRLDLGPGGCMFIVDGNAELIVHPTLTGQSLKDVPNPATGNDLFTDLTGSITNRNGVLAYRSTGDKTAASQTMVGYTGYFEPLDWFICAAYDREKIMQPIKVINRHIVMVSSGFVLIALFLSVLFSKSVAAPIQRLATTASTIEKDGIHDVKIPIGGTTETRELGRVLAAMLASIREHEQQIRTTLHSIGDAVISTDIEARVVAMNPVAVSLTGWSLKEASGQPLDTVFRIINETTRQTVESPAANVLRTGCIVGLANHTLLITKDGREIPIADSGAPIRNDAGQTTGVVLVFRDQTQEREVSQELAESEARFKALHNASFGGITIHDKGFILECNQGLSEITGYTYDELIGMNGLLLISEGTREMVKGKILAGYEKPYEAEGVRKNGELYPIRLEARNIKYKGKDVRVVEFRDISESKQAERVNADLQAKLTQARKLESIGQLAGGVAHDFNNLLMGVMGYIDLCLESIAPDHPSREWLDEIKHETERAANLTRQLLAFARKQTITPKVLDLNDTVTPMLKMLKRLIGENIALTWQPGAKLWAVKLDPGQIDQVLANLCVNARDAIGGQAGKVTIETANISIDDDYCMDNAESSPGDYVLLAFSDDGCGMDHETLQRIFEPFYTTKGIGKGTGLGLATIYGIVKQNNGFINVYSEPEKGTTFRIHLPRVMDMPTTATQSKPTHKAPGGNETVMLVEDERSVRTVLRMQLNNLGYKVLEAESPEAALRLADACAGHIDLLLTDVIMPGMSGRELAEKFKRQYPVMKILYMSGYTANIIANRGIIDEGVQFISKPITSDELAAKVRGILDDVNPIPVGPEQP